MFINTKVKIVITTMLQHCFEFKTRKSIMDSIALYKHLVKNFFP